MSSCYQIFEISFYFLIAHRNRQYFFKRSISYMTNYFVVNKEKKKIDLNYNFCLLLFCMVNFFESHEKLYILIL